MAEGSRDQGSVGITDPEEDSPNMIVYRKVRLKENTSGIFKRALLFFCQPFFLFRTFF